MLEAEDEKNRLRGLVGGGGGPTRGSTPAERKRDALRQLASTGVDPGLSDRPQPSDKRGGRPKDPEVHTGAEPTVSAWVLVILALHTFAALALVADTLLAFPLFTIVVYRWQGSGDTFKPGSWTPN